MDQEERLILRRVLRGDEPEPERPAKKDRNERFHQMIREGKLKPKDARTPLAS